MRLNVTILRSSIHIYVHCEQLLILFIRCFLTGVAQLASPNKMVTYLAVAEDGEEERKAFVDELRRVVVGPHLQEVLQQLIYDGLQAVLVSGGQGVHPTVQCPGNPQVAQV